MREYRIAAIPGAGIDWVIIRENSEGEYAGNGGRVHRGLPEEVGTETAVFTRSGVTRIHRFAFERARHPRPRRHGAHCSGDRRGVRGAVTEIFAVLGKPALA